MTPIRVLLAEDHETVRQGLRLLLESQEDIEVIAEAAEDQGRKPRTPQRRPKLASMMTRSAESVTAS